MKCRPIFRRTLFLLDKTISLDFTDIPASGSSFFGLVETEFLSNRSLGLLYKDLGHFETVFLFGAFFLLLENITEIRCKPVFFGFFSSQQWKYFFWLVKADFPSNAIYSDEWKGIFFLVFSYSEQISCQLKPLFTLR